MARPPGYIKVCQGTYDRLTKLKGEKGLKSLEDVLLLLMDHAQGKVPPAGTLCKTCGAYDDCIIGRDASEYCTGYIKMAACCGIGAGNRCCIIKELSGNSV